MRIHHRKRARHLAMAALLLVSVGCGNGNSIKGTVRIDPEIEASKNKIVLGLSAGEDPYAALKAYYDKTVATLQGVMDAEFPADKKIETEITCSDIRVTSESGYTELWKIHVPCVGVMKIVLSPVSHAHKVLLELHYIDTKGKQIASSEEYDYAKNQFVHLQEIIDTPNDEQKAEGLEGKVSFGFLFEGTLVTTSDHLASLRWIMAYHANVIKEGKVGLINYQGIMEWQAK